VVLNNKQLVVGKRVERETPKKGAGCSNFRPSTVSSKTKNASQALLPLLLKLLLHGQSSSARSSSNKAPQGAVTYTVNHSLLRYDPRIFRSLSSLRRQRWLFQGSAIFAMLHAPLPDDATISRRSYWLPGRDYHNLSIDSANLESLLLQ
jgi:hypothetical protein